MSKDKYPNILPPQMEAIVFIILQIFYTTRAVFKIGEYPRIFPSFSWGISAHVTRLDQSRASENTWWIIINNYSLKSRWIVAEVNILPLFTEIEKNNCFSIYRRKRSQQHFQKETIKSRFNWPLNSCVYILHFVFVWLTHYSLGRRCIMLISQR